MKRNVVRGAVAALAWVALRAAAPSDAVEGFAAPKPINVGASGGIGGTPRLSNGDLITGTAAVELVIDDAGRVSDCARVYPIEGSALADWLCRAMRTYARFHPATDRDGRPVFGTHVQWTRSSLNAFMAPEPDRADITIPINRFPPGATIRRTATVRYLTDKDGRIEACAVTTTSDSPILDGLACSLTDKEAFAPVHDRSGDPVHSVRERIIGFVKQE